MASSTQCGVEIIELDAAQGRAMFDAVCQRHMGISREEFLNRWEAGEWSEADFDQVEGLVDVWMAQPAVMG